MARGVAKLFGIDLMENFRLPYMAASTGDFWSRWHISLSSWFRDYLYIPLGWKQKRTDKGNPKYYANNDFIRAVAWSCLEFSIMGVYPRSITCSI
jgi:D-alanyl-lipoteichoic acid acyltransferase DltB (MBOAT superfamily)